MRVGSIWPRSRIWPRARSSAGAMADHLRTELCFDALVMAFGVIPRRGSDPHSDRGGQYAASRIGRFWRGTASFIDEPPRQLPGQRAYRERVCRTQSRARSSLSLLTTRRRKRRCSITSRCSTTGNAFIPLSTIEHLSRHGWPWKGSPGWPRNALIPPLHLQGGSPLFASWRSPF